MRPNLNSVIDEVVKVLPDKINTPVRIYLNVYDDGGFSVSNESDESSLLLIIGSNSRKFLRKYIKESLDILESSQNVKRRDRARRGRGIYSTEDSNYREDDT